jgi:hypothetical protein
MNEPSFWPEGDDAPPELQQLLSFAEAPRPLDAVARARSRRRLLALAALPAAAGTMFWVQNLALGALLGGAVSVGVAAGTGSFSAREPPAPSVNEPVRPTPPTRVDRTKPSPEPTVAEQPRADGARAFVPAPATTASTAPSSTSDSVAAEARLLESARRALAADPARALELVARHEREYPTGVLAVEREFLAIDALVRSGRRQEAEARGRRMREHAPGSLYEERLERLLGKGE